VIIIKEVPDYTEREIMISGEEKIFYEEKK
jgi:hypothetical protein